jgi:hypothetical protein
MRTGALAFVLLLACGDESFTSNQPADGGSSDATITDANLGDATGIADAAIDGAPDTSGFASDVVLWFDAADAVTLTGDLVSSWPAHSKLVVTPSILTGTGEMGDGCTNGIHLTRGSLNGKPTVQFCEALISLPDDPSVRLGTAPFLIGAVIRVRDATPNGIVLTKAAPSAADNFDGLTMWAKDPASAVEGDLATGVGVQLVNSAETFVYATFLRTTNQIVVRIEGISGSPRAVVNTDVSGIGTPYQIGASVVDADAGNYLNSFYGDLAEVIVLRSGGPASVDAVETYFKVKYALP